MRVQLTIPESRKGEVDILKGITGCKDYAALLDVSLTAFQWMVWEVAQGRSIASVMEGDPKERVLVMKELQSAGEKLPGIINKVRPTAAAETGPPVPPYIKA